jgi:hypothetical protein
MSNKDFNTLQPLDQSSNSIKDPDGVTDIPIYFVERVSDVPELHYVPRYTTCIRCGDLHCNRHMCNDCFDDVNNPRRKFGLTRKQARKV